MIAGESSVGDRQRPGAICLSIADFGEARLGSAIASQTWSTAELLAQRGWQVHVLGAGAGDRGEEGVAFHALEDLPVPPGVGTPHYGGDDPIVALGEHVLEALEALHAEHRFDLIEFPDRRALGFRAIQAKASADALLDTRLAVKLNAPTRWRRQQELRLRSSPRDLKLEFCERYAFEHADVQLGTSRYLLDWPRQVGWRVRDDAAVAYAYPAAGPELAAEAAEIRRLAFAGPLKRRRELQFFLDALDLVEPDMPALFLTAEASADAAAVELIEKRLGDRPHRIETEVDRGRALAEMQGGDYLVVIASPADDLGLSVADCVVNRVSFLAARAGGAPELVDHVEGRARWLFEPDAIGMRKAIERRLSASSASEAQLRGEVAATCNPERWNDRVEVTYRGVIGRPPRSRPRAVEPATVTVAVPHYNHDRFLPAALASLAAQSRPPEEVIVVDDGSTSEAARRVFAEQEALYPDWTFVRRENAGPGAVRNYCLERATGAYFLPFDSDNIATPHLVGRLLGAMDGNPERAATTCHGLAFVEDADIAAGTFAFRYAPIGGPRLSACVENVYGDTCALFRAERLRAVGGFEAHRWSPYEDWDTFVKMTVQGGEVDVLPRPLFYYRTDSGGRLQTLTADPSVSFRHGALLIDEFLADSELTPLERRDLWESLRAFDRVVAVDLGQRLDEQQRWHESQLNELRTVGARESEEVRVRLSAEVEAQRARAEAAEHELATLAAITARRLLGRVLHAARGRLSRSSRSGS